MRTPGIPVNNKIRIYLFYLPSRQTIVCSAVSPASRSKNLLSGHGSYYSTVDVLTRRDTRDDHQHQDRCNKPKLIESHRNGSHDILQTLTCFVCHQNHPVQVYHPTCAHDEAALKRRKRSIDNWKSRNQNINNSMHQQLVSHILGCLKRNQRPRNWN